VNIKGHSIRRRRGRSGVLEQGNGKLLLSRGSLQGRQGKKPFIGTGLV